MVWDLLSLSLFPPPLLPWGKGEEEESTRGMGVFDLGGLNLEGGESIYIKGQCVFFVCVCECVSIFLKSYCFSELVL